MTDEIRLVSELTGDTYKNSVGSEIAVIKIGSDVLMTSKELAKVYGVSVPTICKKLKRIFESGELAEKQVSSILTHKAADGKLYRTTYYNSQVIVQVGAMLRSPEAVNFQRWMEVNYPSPTPKAISR